MNAASTLVMKLSGSCGIDLARTSFSREGPKVYMQLCPPGRLR